MDNKTIDELLGLVIGLMLMIFGFSKRKQRHELLEKGIKTEGVVFSVEKKYDNLGNDSDGFNRSTALYYPVIRYITLENEWITEEYNIGMSYSSAYKEGDKVKVVYDPAKTSIFILEDGSTSFVAPAFIIGGALTIIASLIYYFSPNIATHS